MSLSITDLRERASQTFSEVDQVDDTILRCLRSAGTEPAFAVYYLDIGHHLPDTSQALTSYQDRVIGRYYFKGRKSLQWNNYLYFLLEEDHFRDPELTRAKRFIEGDRAYARKFVIPESDLDSVLNPPAIAHDATRPQPDVLTIWSNKLAEAGIDNAILGDGDLPSRLRKIEDSRVRARPPARTQKSAVKPGQFIQELALQQYRPLPRQRQFRFGIVNLFVGPNASGKTSLMEAIELFYCGRNKRNAESKPSYRLSAVLWDGTPETATDSRRPAVFRDRNLSWYGQSEDKTNNLYQSFARFNFLDTDAAVGLSETTTHLEENLSKLLVGPDAARVWRNMERVDETLKAQLRDARRNVRQMREELGKLNKQIGEAAGTAPESKAIRTRLEDLLQRHRWSLIGGGDDDVADEIIGIVSEFLAVASQVDELRWMPGPVSLASLSAYCQESTTNIEEASRRLEALLAVAKDQAELSRSIDSAKRSIQLARQLEVIRASGVLDRAARRMELQSVVSDLAGRLAPVDLENVPDLGAHLAEPVDAALRTATVIREAAIRSLDSARREYERFAQLREQAENLAQQLRDIAEQIISGSSEPDMCPLCHTRFEPGQLATHMVHGVDQQADSLAQALLTKIREHEEVAKHALAIERALASLQEYCHRSDIALKQPVRDVLARLSEATRKLENQRQELVTLEEELTGLHAQGYSEQAYDGLVADLQTLGHVLSDISRETLQQVAEDAQALVTRLSANFDEQNEQYDRARSELQIRLGSDADDTNSLRSALSRRQEQRSTAQALHADLSALIRRLPWPDDRPLAELVVALEAVRSLSVSWQSAMNSERELDAFQQRLQARKAEVDQALEKIQPRLDRFEHAHSVLRELLTEHSLSAAMDDVLQQNREAIQSIFFLIHSPAEFSELALAPPRLVRRIDENEVKLSEISTGQRAAVALSVFLAQNSQLRSAPPVLLIDDPVAHVDDLNSLSFLDFLREMVITGERQVFFATADDKLAALFERKFDFLGEDRFRRFDMTRED